LDTLEPSLASTANNTITHLKYSAYSVEERNVATLFTQQTGEEGEKIRVIKPANGKGFDFREVYEIIQCEVIEAIFFNNGRCMLIDEQPNVYPDKPQKIGNRNATLYVQKYSPYTLMSPVGIEGSALLLTAAETLNDRDIEEPRLSAILKALVEPDDGYREDSV
jgi:hypothetical protein